MFTRQQMKTAAKNNFTRNMEGAIGASALTFLPSIVLFIIAYIFPLFVFIIFLTDENDNADTMLPLLLFSFFIFLAAIANLLITSILNTGFSRFFLKTRGMAPVKAGEVFLPLKEGYTGNILKAILPLKIVQSFVGAGLMSPFFLIFLLFHAILSAASGNTQDAGKALLPATIFSVISIFILIPSALYVLKYALLPFVVASDASRPRSSVMALSARLMKGQNGKLCSLYFSFIGWFLLGGLFGGLFNLLYVKPYFTAALAEFYSCRRAELIYRGELSPFELPSFGSDWYSPVNPNGPFSAPPPASPYGQAPGTQPPYPQSAAHGTLGGGFVNDNPNDYIGFAAPLPSQPPQIPHNEPTDGST